MTQLFRWAGALLFLLSLLSMPAMYFLRLGTPSLPDDSTALDAATNVVLFTLFALHHSVMARSGAKAWITRFVPAELERSVYVWIASLLFLFVCLMWQPLPGIVWQVGGPGFALYLTQLFGLALTLSAAARIGIRELAGLEPSAPARPVEFRADGPFGLVRHPIYLGWVLMVFATPLMTSSRLLFAVVSTIYLVIAIPLEEALLVKTFGEKYSAYQRQMRWRLIPGVW